MSSSFVWKDDCAINKRLREKEGAMKNGQHRVQKTKKNKTKTTQYVFDTIIWKQTQITKIRHEHSYKQLEIKTSFLSRNALFILVSITIVNYTFQIQDIWASFHGPFITSIKIIVLQNWFYLLTLISVSTKQLILS